MTVVQNPEGEFVALGWPGCLRMRHGMLKHFPDLMKDLDFWHPANDLERNKDPETALVRLFPEEVATQHYHSNVVAEIPLKAIVKLEWSPKRKKWIFRPVANGQPQSWGIGSKTTSTGSI